ncbi:MAG: TonB family protein [Candidatus Obscuribacterales bacterium]|nr:TonB family protein [Candidatus Obscuribacterales bacterium]
MKTESTISALVALLALSVPAAQSQQYLQRRDPAQSQAPTQQMKIPVIMKQLSDMQKTKLAAPTATSKARVDFEHKLYLKRLTKRIDEHLRPLDKKPRGRTVVFMKIEREGNLSELRMERSSGDREADFIALQAAKKASPFGQMPQSFKSGMALHFEIHFGAGGVRGTDFEPYLVEIKRKILSIWTPPDTKDLCQASVVFALNREGQITNCNIKTSSGDRAVDEAAMEAVRHAAPFGRLPDPNMERLPMEYVLAAGPREVDMRSYQQNGVPLPKPDFGAARGSSGSASGGGSSISGSSSGGTTNVGGNFERKLEARQAALKDKVESLRTALESEDDPAKRVATSSDIAQCYSDLHDYDNACRSLTDALSLEKNNGETERYGFLLSQLAANHVQLNRVDDAAREYAESVAILRKYESSKPQLVNALTSYAKILYKSNKPREADALYKEIQVLNRQ